MKPVADDKENHPSRWATAIVQTTIALLTLASAWGMLRQTVADVEDRASRIQGDIRSIVEVQGSLVTRVSVLETNRQVQEERLSQIKSTLKDIDDVTRSLHDNVLILCQMSTSRDRCKP